MKCFVVSVITLAGFLSGMPASSSKSYNFTESEIHALLNEADDFIDAIPEGAQDRKCDAVLHAMRGQTGELKALRDSKETSPNLSSEVERTEITGDGVMGLRMRLYRPLNRDGERLPLLVYFHGGGWSEGGINSCSTFCDALASKGSVIVLAMDYSLAPENPWPQGLKDCVAGFEYAVKHAEEWGSMPELVSLGGDDAGGNLALASQLYMLEENKTMVKARSLVLVYPIIKAYNDRSESWRKYSRGYGLDSRLMEAFNDSYMGENKEELRKNSLISPADAPSAKLKELPPVLLVAAERDILSDQGEEFDDMIRNLGVKSERVELSGAVHGFITEKGQPTAFLKSVGLISDFLVSLPQQ